MNKLTALVLGDWHYDSYRVGKRGRTVANVVSGANFLTHLLQSLAKDGPLSHWGIESWLPSDPTDNPRVWGLEEFNRNEGSPAYRIRGDQFSGSIDLKSPKSRVVAAYRAAPINDTSALDTMIIHDSSNGHAWCTETTTQVLTSFITDKCKVPLNANRNQLPCIWFMPKSLPTVRLHAYRSPVPCDNSIWKLLADPNIAGRTCVITSANELRRCDSAVSTRLSWEQSVEDFMTDLHTFPPMQCLSRFAHLIVRFGHTGILHIRNVDGRQLVRFTLAPTAKHSIFRDPVDEGRVIGKSTVILASLLSLFGSRNDHPNGADIESALRHGLYATMHLFKQGFPDPRAYRTSKVFLARYFAPLLSKSLFDAKQITSDPDEACHTITIPTRVVERPAGRMTDPSSDWEILREQLNIGDDDARSGNGLSRINIALAMVRYGYKFVLNRDFPDTVVSDLIKPPKTSTDILLNVKYLLQRPSCSVAAEEVLDHITLAPGRSPLFPQPGMTLLGQPHAARKLVVPIGAFQNLVTAERAEMESFRSIRNLLKRHFDYWSQRLDWKDATPISVAVFGPPGSGKSFAAKQIAKSIPKVEQQLRIHELNLSQFSKIEDLHSELVKLLKEYPPLTRTRKAVSSLTIPLIFVDEFDCRLGSEPLGWLKYFLAAMQEGTMHTAKKVLKFGPTIFVFAGGITSKFASFDPSSRAEIQEDSLDPQELRRSMDVFRNAKGTDFVSRLRGHVDIKSVSRAAGMSKPMIRRALILRGLVEKDDRLMNSLEVPLNGDKKKLVRECAVHEDIIYALLTADRFRHGARSMEAILSMCNPFDEFIRHASLPSRVQLGMHVDPDEFLTRVHRSRFRRCAAKAMISGSDEEVTPSTKSAPEQLPSAKVVPDDLNKIATVKKPKKKRTKARVR